MSRFICLFLLLTISRATSNTNLPPLEPSRSPKLRGEDETASILPDGISESSEDLTETINRPPHFSDKLAPRQLAHRIVDAMSDREALGQILMFGYPGRSPERELLRLIEKEELGGVKVFGWNANDLSVLAETVGSYQSKAIGSRFGIPLLIATDQEGGWVRHVKGGTSITPGNMALGADKLPIDAWKTGSILGQELAAVGINTNFAPSVDIFINPKADVIGPRAFMSNPHWTAILGLSFFRGLEEAGVISVAKHFPGHGDTKDDSHGTLPKIYADLETLQDRDLIPYKTMIAADIPAIMAGHLALPSITGNEIPSTLSYSILTELLRKELGFEGIVITDDIFMQGARNGSTPIAEICYRAIMAGADILLASKGGADRRGIHQHLLEGMKGDEFNHRVREAAGRVIALKAEYLKAPNAVPLQPDPSKADITVPGAAEFFLEQAARSVTLLRSERFPLKPEQSGRVLLAGTYADFFAEGIKRYPEARRWTLNYAESKAGLQSGGRELLRIARGFDSVIVLLPDEEMGILLDELAPIAEKVIVISVLSPIHLSMLDWSRTSLAAYGTGRESFQAAFAALIGDFTPEGELPISDGLDMSMLRNLM